MQKPYQMIALLVPCTLLGCGGDKPPETPQGAAAAAATTAAATTGADALIAAALVSPMRSDADRERDVRSKPDVILGLLDLQPGDSVADILGGGGYYTDLMAAVVGADGHVILQNNAAYDKVAGERARERFAGGAEPNVTYLKSEADDLELPAGSLDAALMVMSFHDLYYTNPERGWDQTDVPLFLSQVHDALKPGGRLLIVDHAAVSGTGATHAQDLHRIDEAFVQQVIEDNGFALVASSDALRNPEDDRTKMVFDKNLRGHTDRFILMFERR